MNFEIYNGKRVLVTGHTGFKGSWLCEWLLALGAEVYGFALEPPTEPALFTQLELGKRLAGDERGDVRDRAAVVRGVARVRPDFVFHLAAQPIVRESYRTPAETFDTNVMGTVNVLEAVRLLDYTCPVVCITTDKVYENDNSGRAFVEGDPLGGCDPYSASKGACEIAIASYRRSFPQLRVASARAGNVIGGGDWAADRLVPDAMRAFLAERPLVVRNPASTRPWQHVLEPLSGYLALGAWLAAGATAGAPSPRSMGTADAMAFNFGPDSACVKTVGDLVVELRRHFPTAEVEAQVDPNAPPEAKLLRLDSTKSAKVLGWGPKWDFATTIAATAQWYQAVAKGEAAAAACRRQIEEFGIGR